MKILHTEASPGWGGQEIRILREASGMRKRGHEVIFAIQKGGGLVETAKNEGFIVYEVELKRSSLFKAFFNLLSIVRKHDINLINTHSSFDAWMGGLLGKLLRIPVLRTRHLSTPIRKGLNSKILYNYLADIVVTTCADIVDVIVKQAKLPKSRCFSIPTGVDPSQLNVEAEKVLRFRENLGLKKDDCLVGTLCILRGWKGITDLLWAAKELQDVPHLKWIIVGGGVSEEHFRKEWKELGLENKVVFTGHLSNPYTALAAMDIFLLLSWAHEGVSQASLQAAWLEKPLVTTETGGLKEVCIDEVTGYQVPLHSPKEVADRVVRLLKDPQKRQEMGKMAHKLVEERFTFEKMLDQMEVVYKKLQREY
jgi:glycosyltransferase involved in cell wall biosynthesis